MARAVVHLGLDEFLVSVEVRKRPALKGARVVVGTSGDPAGRGVVLAASCEARRRKVKAGMELRQAHRLCPEAAFVQVDFESCERVSERFMAVLRDFSPLVESFGLDEAFVEIAAAGGADPFPVAIELARQMKERVFRETGLAASVGVAPNKLLAKMASNACRPDGLLVVEEKEADRFLRELPVRRLCGVGARTDGRLRELGIRTIGELAKTPAGHLERNFGASAGRSLHEHARGVDSSRVVPFHEPASLGREVAFEEESTDRHFIKEALCGLAKDLVLRLKANRSAASEVAVKVSFSDFMTSVVSARLEQPSDSMNEILTRALALFDSMDLARPVKLVGVKVCGLEGR